MIRIIKIAQNKIYDKITTYASKLVETGEDIAQEYGIPIINKRISVTPVSLAACRSEEEYIQLALTLDRAAKEVGVNFLGGYSALVQKGITHYEDRFLNSIPMALKETERVCSSVNVGSTKSGIILTP